MRVAYVLSQNQGGLPHYAAELANAVSEHAEVAVFKPTDTTADTLFSDTVETVSAFENMTLSIPDLYGGNFDVLENVRALYSYRNIDRIREFDPDVVHDPTDFFPQVKLFTKLHGIDREFPFVVTYHEVPPPIFSLGDPFATVESALDRVIPDVDHDRLIVHSEAQQRAFGRRFGRPQTIDVIPHGAYDFFTDQPYTPQPEESATVLFFGNIFPGKGLDVLAEAITLAAESVPELTLVICGDGEFSDQTQSIIDSNPDRFEVHNYFIPNDDVGEFFTRATLVALPYRPAATDGTKGHSGALSTAHAFGKPVVSTSIGDFPRLVGDAGAGRVVEPNDPDALAEAILEMLSDDELRSSMAERSSEQADRHSWESIARQHLDAYAAAIERFERRTTSSESLGVSNELIAE
ncbi:glycosyltransferase family 4 protein [Halocatena halophila]|uniref:glycosyltransferase family 4 protein n=1 Tax=Halocatena halophila TaxID=2814576 RepID=UPI002ED54CEA